MGRLTEHVCSAGAAAAHAACERVPTACAAAAKHWASLHAWAAERTDQVNASAPWVLETAGDVAGAARVTASGAATAANAALEGWEQWEIAAAAAAVTLALAWLLSRVSAALRGSHGGMAQHVFAVLRSLPPLSWYIAKEKAKMRADLRGKRPGGGGCGGSEFSALPARGLSEEQALATVEARAADDLKFAEGQSPLSGAVYIGSDSHLALLNKVYEMYSVSNPLHADVWPSLRQMEAEVVSMTASMLGGGPGSGVCGAMTSGGTESILSAMKASRDYMQAVRGIRHPEMIMAVSAHAAYVKACEYFRIKAVVVKVDKDFRMTAAAVRARVNANTAIIVASAPGFPHGVMDHVADIAAVARRARVCLHVDACLGGFVLPFVRKLPGRTVPPFDFSVRGVTSMSVDTHKFGLAHKGTSVVLYSSSEIRKHQYTGIVDWSGGLYISPGMAGSRPGALVASAWASLVKNGVDGYVAQAERMMAVADRFRDGVSRMPLLAVLGRPEMCLVAFAATHPSKLNIYKVNDLLTQRGWHLNALQSPPALHFCFTGAHTLEVVDRLLDDLTEAVKEVSSNPNCVKGGSAPMYGMANVSPDRGLINEFLVTYQDVMLET
mmetsp:Transcript_26506/g.78723  ORF Transcript_26506/g.78723 Transcript_26506/m.78723 type:complete len:609 (-) Transcript_26506:649-2475(-)